MLALRSAKGMVLDPSDPDTRSTGSFFTNPIVDADGHWLEMHPVFVDYIAEAAGPAAADAYEKITSQAPGFGGNNLMTPEMRLRRRYRRGERSCDSPNGLSPSSPPLTRSTRSFCL